MGSKRAAMTNDTQESKILKEIRISEKESEEIIGGAVKEQERIIDSAKKISSRMLEDKKEEVRREQEKNLADLKEKTDSIRKEKIEDGKKAAKQMKVKAEKNINKAVDFVMNKFGEMI